MVEDDEAGDDDEPEDEDEDRTTKDRGDEDDERAPAKPADAEPDAEPADAEPLLLEPGAPRMPKRDWTLTILRDKNGMHSHSHRKMKRLWLVGGARQRPKRNPRVTLTLTLMRMPPPPLSLSRALTLAGGRRVLAPDVKVLSFRHSEEEHACEEHLGPAGCGDDRWQAMAILLYFLCSSVQGSLC